MYCLLAFTIFYTLFLHILLTLPSFSLEKYVCDQEKLTKAYMFLFSMKRPVNRTASCSNSLQKKKKKTSNHVT